MKDQSITTNHEVAVGGPACDLVIAWTYLLCKSREIFIEEIYLDQDTCLGRVPWHFGKQHSNSAKSKIKITLRQDCRNELINEVMNGYENV